MIKKSYKTDGTSNIRNIRNTMLGIQRKKQPQIEIYKACKRIP